jgi:anti-sigma factor RsiW
MNWKSQIKLQAYLDGELSARQARPVAGWLARDCEAQALFAELQHTKTILTENEPEWKLPESRDFFWSRIIRQIDRPGPARAAPPPWSSLLRWWKWLAPIGAAAALALLLWPRNPASYVAALNGLEVEMAIPESRVATFRSEAEGVSVVWVETQ